MNPDWRSILTRAWSIRFIVLAALFSGAEVALSVLDAASLGVKPGVFAALASIAAAGAFIARLMTQGGVVTVAEDP